MIRKLTLVAVSAIVLSGCNFGSMARVNPNTVASYGVPSAGTFAKNGYKSTANSGCPFTSGLDDTQNGAINLDCFKFPGDEGKTTAYQLATQPLGADDSQQRYARNRLAAVLVKHADDVCVLEKGRIVGREGALNFGLGTTTTALSTIATVVSGELAKTILSGGAAFTSSVQGHAAESFYRNQVTQAINAAMDGERDRIRDEIATARGSRIVDFTVDDMIRLVNQYHQACSYERGLQLLVKAAGGQDIAASRAAANKMATLILERNIAQREAEDADAARKPYWQDRVKDFDARIADLAGLPKAQGPN